MKLPWPLPGAARHTGGQVGGGHNGGGGVIEERTATAATGDLCSRINKKEKP
jgi:hypothetical protein